MQSNNPAGTKGFEFLEFTTNDLNKLTRQFTDMGFAPVAKHKKHDVTIYQQNNVRFIVNNTDKTMARKFAKVHGASACAMGFLVEDANKAFDMVVSQGAEPYVPKDELTIYDVPAIRGVGGSLIYFIDYKNGIANYAADFNYLVDQPEQNTGLGLTYIDHVTHNLYRGNMDKLADYYTRLFNFKEIRYFDIEGKLTGLKSRAMTSPCGNIRIPLNESSDDISQIEEFLHEFNGEGIQHIALGTDDIYTSVSSLSLNGLKFLDTPDTYYELIEKRLPNHGESVEKMKELRILIDGDTSKERKLLLQIFTNNMLGPVFFEVIQRKGDQGFGEGNFRALFESIELDQIRRGVLNEETAKS